VRNLVFCISQTGNLKASFQLDEESSGCKKPQFYWVKDTKGPRGLIQLVILWSRKACLVHIRNMNETFAYSCSDFRLNQKFPSSVKLFNLTYSISTMSQANTPRDVRAFCYERRYYNTALRFTEVERLVLLAEDTRSLTAEDVARGINFIFVPLEAMLVPSVTDLSDFYRRLLRINFEAALARLRRHATLERHNVMAQESATPIQLNHSLLRMFVPQDLHHPVVNFQAVTEPIGFVPPPSPTFYQGAPGGLDLFRVDTEYHQSMSRLVSGALSPNGQMDMGAQKRRLEAAAMSINMDKEHQIQTIQQR